MVARAVTQSSPPFACLFIEAGRKLGLPGGGIGQADLGNRPCDAREKRLERNYAYDRERKLRFHLQRTGRTHPGPTQPQGYRELCRTTLMEPTYPFGGRKLTWAAPSFANRHVYARNEKEIICASLRQ